MASQPYYATIDEARAAAARSLRVDPSDSRLEKVLVSTHESPITEQDVENARLKARAIYAEIRAGR